ncbi:hypothetical protein [Haloglomus litoreum]|uniref:hypothetical protein n=1 Tax=Haloglomus litoreum TaxID=3034026 RepID=UPI0023E7CA0C|nr:hypothetical protein [Haloglomus sp. DT116]
MDLGAADVYETSVTTARENLERAGDLDAFLFAVSEDGDLNATIGTNESGAGAVPLEELVGIALLLLARSHDIHPAVLAHGAAEFAIENYDATE